MSELAGNLSEKPERDSFLRRLAAGLMIGAYEQMGVPPERARQAYEGLQRGPAVTSSPSPADLARAARAYDPDRLARSFRGNFRRH